MLGTLSASWPPLAVAGRHRCGADGSTELQTLFGPRLSGKHHQHTSSKAHANGHLTQGGWKICSMWLDASLLNNLCTLFGTYSSQLAAHGGTVLGNRPHGRLDSIPWPPGACAATPGRFSAMTAPYGMSGVQKCSPKNKEERMGVSASRHF